MSEATPDRHVDWRILCPLVTAAFASAMSMTIMPVAVPAVSRQFGLGQDLVHWVSTGFMTAMTFAMLLTPWLIGRFSVRRIHECSVLLMLGGALCASLTPNFPSLVVARLLEGMAAGVLQPLPVIVVSHAFGDGHRGRAMGVFTLGAVLAPAFSPVLGGVLIESFGWRTVPLALVPMGLLALSMGRWLASCDLRSDHGHRPRHRPLDFVSLFLGGMALFCILASLSRWRVGSGWSTACLMLLSLLATAAFLRRQRRHTHPLLSPQVFTDRRFALTCIVAFVYGVGMFGSAYLIPVFMQQAMNRSPVEAGAVMLPAGLLLAVASPLGGWLADCLAAHRVIATGMGLIACSFFALRGVDAGSTLLFMAALLLVSRLGMALVLPSLNLSALKELPRHRWTDGATGINLIRQLGASLGVSAVAAFLQWRLHRAQGSLADPSRLPASAFHETFALLAVIAALGALVAWKAQKTV